MGGDLGKITNERGENKEIRSECGEMEGIDKAIRPSQGIGRTSGWSSEYLPVRYNPGMLVRGTSADNARAICNNGLNRGERWRIHDGVLKALCQLDYDHGHHLVA